MKRVEGPVRALQGSIFEPTNPLNRCVQTTRIQVNGERVHLIGICQGLEGEAEEAIEAIEDQTPAVVALALDPGVVERIDELEPARALGAEDEAYMKGLSEWGSVKLPAPTYPAAVEAAGRIDARVEGIDMHEGEYLERHLDRVGVLDMVKRALRVRWLGYRPPRADTPAAFCQAFDQKVNGGPLAGLQRAREQAMAKRLVELASEDVLAIVEIERLEGVTRALRGPRAGDP